MQAKNKYSRAMRDACMVKPAKPQAVRNKPTSGICLAIIAIFAFLLLPALVR